MTRRLCFMCLGRQLFQPRQRMWWGTAPTVRFGAQRFTLSAEGSLPFRLFVYGWRIVKDVDIPGPALITMDYGPPHVFERHQPDQGIIQRTDGTTPGMYLDGMFQRLVWVEKDCRLELDVENGLGQAVKAWGGSTGYVDNVNIAPRE